jgi:hypothetical protein
MSFHKFHAPSFLYSSSTHTPTKKQSGGRHAIGNLSRLDFAHVHSPCDLEEPAQAPVDVPRVGAQPVLLGKAVGAADVPVADQPDGMAAQLIAGHVAVHAARVGLHEEKC